MLIIQWVSTQYTLQATLPRKNVSQKNRETICQFKISSYFCIALEENLGRLAQLVQSICLTSRGSAVRIRQRPHKYKHKVIPLHKALQTRVRAFSSAGSEHLPYQQRVGGSNPSTPTTHSTQTFVCYLTTWGRLAQLVQSICLTSRGSAVRIRQRPHKYTQFDSLFLLQGV